MSFSQVRNKIDAVKDFLILSRDNWLYPVILYSIALKEMHPVDEKKRGERKRKWK